MAYRDDEAADALEAPTAEGPLRVELGPGRASLSLAGRNLVIADRIATLTEGKKRKDLELPGPLVVARGVPREDFGIWLEVVAEPGERTMRRIFGVEPLPLLRPEGLPALRKLDALYQRLRAHLAELGRGIARAFEIGSGHPLDKVLVADHGDRFELYARSLFHQGADPIATVFVDGRVRVREGKRAHEVEVTSRFGVTVRGDYIRFADRHGTDLARLAIPWIGPEDREELARRIGQLVDRT